MALQWKENWPKLAESTSQKIKTVIEATKDGIRQL
jgi:hypothetical protein